MAIQVQCGACGMDYRVAEGVAGKRVRCRECGEAIRVPGATAAGPAKLCISCGIDVAGLWRTKDAQGNYYCQQCATPAAAPPSSRDTLPSRSPAQVAPVAGDSDDLLSLAASLAPRGDDDSAVPLRDVESPASPALQPRPTPKAPARRTPSAAPIRRNPVRNFASAPISGGAVALVLGGALLALGAAAFINHSLAAPAIMVYVVTASALVCWGGIGILITAFQISPVHGLLYMFVPGYAIIFILTHVAEIQHHLAKFGGGVAIFFLAGVISKTAGH